MRHIVNVNNKDMAQQAIDEIKHRFNERKAFSVDIDDVRVLHSSEQSGYYWKHLKEFGKHFGMNAKESEDVIHRELKCRLFGVKKTLNVGGAIIQIPNGSSSKLSKSEYSRLIELLIQLAGEHFYTIPDPQYGTLEEA